MTPPAKAYELAGYTGDPRWHRYNASKLTNKPSVRERIEELSAEFDQRAGIHAEYIKRCLLPIVEANAADLFTRDEAGKLHLKAIGDLPRNLAAAISKIKTDPDTGAIVEINLADKVSAGGLLLRSVGGLIDRKEHTGSAGGPITLATLVGQSMAQEIQRKQGDDDDAGE
ncbi:Terminase small subunit [Bradyrhizobium brasilense]|uniref:Terminase small subunit n=1 Tax=Bradyrhizobium brasilense TaxID=1419277 RepID=A0A1G6L6A4_9BRAD|nr:terminase small subunit [Bradyrhizobium brasilense]SDC38668.1 Terminase small subunit [Bradyrhizobium brasilense]